MKIVQGITDQGNQRMTLILADGSRVTLTLQYKPQQISWFYDLSWPGRNNVPFVLTGQRVVSSPNGLRQFRDLIPFGLGVITAQNIEPTTLTAFIDGTAQLLLLDEADVLNIEATIYPGL